jgi:hypothetical protein
MVIGVVWVEVVVVIIGGGVPLDVPDGDALLLDGRWETPLVPWATW